MIVFSAPIEQHPPHLAFRTAPTATNVDGSFPAKNLLDYSPTKVMRTVTGSTSIVWDFGRTRRYNVVSLVSTNCSYRAMLTIYTSNDGSAWTQVDTGPLWAHLATQPALAGSDEDLDPRKGSLERNSSWFYVPEGLNSRYVRLDVTDELTTNMTFGRLFVGRTWKPKSSYQYGSSFYFDDTGRKDRTEQGALVLDGGKAIVGAKAKMDFISSDEMYDVVYDFNYWRQGSREILTCLDVNTVRRLQKNLLYCTITDGRSVSADSFNAWSQTWVLESI
jgi:hypothetical protein